MPDDRKTKPMSGPPIGGEARVQIPDRVGAVVLERQLGEGGMGVVWRGRHELLGRDVAVKFLTHAVEGEADPGFKMFIDGARAAAAVKHPGLTQVFDAGVMVLPPQGQVPYLVMELVDGPGLDAVLRVGGPLSVEAALAVMEGVCAAIGELHAAGFVHRDIKPANVLLDADGGVHVTDFGLACERSSVGMAKVVVSGTPAYMAPETFRGEVSARSDVYSLAMMLHELLTGETPFSGDLLAMRTAHEVNPVPRAGLLARGVSEALADVIERGANKNPMLRPRSALHFLESLRAACPNREGAGSVEVRSLVSRARGESTAESGAAPAPARYYQTIAERAEEKRKSEPKVEEAVDGPPVRPGVRCALCGYELKGLSETGKCPECGGAIEKSTRPKPLPCVQCGYDLVGMDAAGKCPECGGEVRESVRPERLLFADVDWLRSTARGLGLMNWGLGGFPIAMLGLAAIMSLLGRAQGGAINTVAGVGVVLVFVAALLAVTIGVVRATVREPGKKWGVNRWARVAWLAGPGLLIAAWVVEWAEPKMPDGFLAIPGLHLLLLGVVLLGIMVERLGERVPDRKLIKSGRSVFWPWILVLVLWLAATVSRAKWIGVQTSIDGLRLLTVVAGVGMLYSIVLTSAARKQLVAAANLATEPAEGRRASAMAAPGRLRIPWAGAAVAGAVFSALVAPMFMVAPRFELLTYQIAQRLGLLVPPAGKVGYTVVVAGREFPGNPPMPLGATGFVLTIVTMYGVPLVVGILIYLRFARRIRDGVTRCGWCGYALSGVPDARCPECGVAIGGKPDLGAMGPAWGRGKRWRAMLVRMAGAGAVFTGVLGLVYVGLIVPLQIPEPGPDFQGMLVVIAVHLPAFLAALAAFHLMVRSIVSLGGKTLCGACGVELQGLKDGCCAGCGTRV